MGAFSAIFVWFLLGLMVGIIFGFLEAWKEIIVHIVFGFMIIAATLICGAVVVSGEAASAITVPWYEYVGVGTYVIGFLIGDVAGNQYYQEATEALNA